MIDKHPYEILEKVLEQYPRPADFKIRQLPGLSTPLIFGVKKPVILLPETDYSDDDLFRILSHETAHYYNRDFWPKTAVRCLCCLYWWNPLVFLLKKQIAIWLEIRADLTATRQMDEREKIGYLEFLVGEGKKRVKSSYNDAPMCFRGTISSLKQRVLFMMRQEESESTYKYKKCISLILTAIVAIAFWFSYAIVLEPYAILPEDMDGTVKLTEETAYLVQNQNDGYDVYVGGEYFATVTKIQDSLASLPIYKNSDEVKTDENH